LQFFTADDSKITVRPSGTEPKIKFYFGVKEPYSTQDNFEEMSQRLTAKIEKIIKDMKIQ